MDELRGDVGGQTASVTASFLRKEAVFVEPRFLYPDLMSLVLGGHANTDSTAPVAHESHGGLHGARAGMW